MTLDAALLSCYACLLRWSKGGRVCRGRCCRCAIYNPLFSLRTRAGGRAEVVYGSLSVDSVRVIRERELFEGEKGDGEERDGDGDGDGEERERGG